MIDQQTEAQLLHFLFLTNKKISAIRKGQDTLTIDDRLALYAVGSNVAVILKYSDNPYADTVIKGSWKLIRSVDERLQFGVFSKILETEEAR